MSRELKFRAWNGESMLTVRTLDFHLEGISTLCRESDGWYADGGCELMQYTGLKDKNGKEIYEGDIVKAHHYEFDEDWIDVVRYKAPNFTVGNRRYWKDGCHDWYSMEQFESFELEVIGNIYENSELLGAEE